MPPDCSPSIWAMSSSLRFSTSAILFTFAVPCNFSMRALSSDRLVVLLRSNSCVLMTVPRTPESHRLEVSFTSPAFSPKIALNSFSSGVGSVSPLGVTLPTRISPGDTSAPTRIMPLSSRLRVASSLTLGISLVSSSAPRLVSRTSISAILMWMEESTSSLSRRSLIMMASSKL